MILHKLLWRFAFHRDDDVFYNIQAADAIAWLAQRGVPIRSNFKALDLGCGHGIFGLHLQRLGGDVTFADQDNYLAPAAKGLNFIKVDLDNDRLDTLGKYDLVVCSNVLEHLRNPSHFLSTFHHLLLPHGYLYLSWTNWLSPWGGHEFSPFHYLGATIGPRIYDSISSRQRFHYPHKNLFPTYIGKTLSTLKQNPHVRLNRAVPRYYPELSIITSIPFFREFATWNCACLVSLSSFTHERDDRAKKADRLHP